MKNTKFLQTILSLLVSAAPVYASGSNFDSPLYSTFEHSFADGKVTIKVGEGDYSAFDMYKSPLSTNYAVDNGVIMGGSPNKEVDSAPSQNAGVKTVSLTIDGATVKDVLGVGFRSSSVSELVEIEMNSGTVTGSIIGSVNYPSSGNATPSGTAPFAAKTGDIKITVNGGTVNEIRGGNNGSSSLIKDALYGSSDEDYAALMAAKPWSVGGNITINVHGGTVGEIQAVGGSSHSVDGDVNILVDGGEVTGDIVAGPQNIYAEVGGSVNLKVTGDAKVGGDILGAHIDDGRSTAKPTDNGVKYPGAAAPTVANDVYMEISGNAVVEGNVYAAGNEGKVEGNTVVSLQDNAVVKKVVSGGGINGATVGKTSTLLVGTADKAYTGSVGDYVGFDEIIVMEGSSLTVTEGNIFGTGKQTITLSAENLRQAAISGAHADVEEQLSMTLLSNDKLATGKYILVQSDSAPTGWSADSVTVDGIAGYDDLMWEGNVLYLIYAAANPQIGNAANWGVFKSSQAFVSTLRGKHANAVTLDIPSSGKRALNTNSYGKTIAWGAVYGHGSRISSVGADYSLYGAAIGAERRISTRSSLGVAMGYDWGRVSPFTESAVKQETLHLALYGQAGSWNLGKGSLSVDWSLAYGDTTSEHDQIAEDWEQESLQADVRATYSRTINNRTTGSAFVGMQYYAHESDTVDGMNISSMQNLRMMLGGGLSYLLTPRTTVWGELALYHDVMRHNSKVSIEGKEYKGTNPGRTGAMLSVGAYYEINNRWSAQGGYTFDAAEDSIEHNVNAGVIYKF